jgi:hypothetical protein
VTQAQFDAVCQKAAALPCTKQHVPDRGDVYLWGYADGDNSDGTVRSERAVYFVRGDGKIVLASLTLSGTGAASDVPPVNTWMHSWDDELITAATNPKVQYRAGD